MRRLAGGGFVVSVALWAWLVSPHEPAFGAGAFDSESLEIAAGSDAAEVIDNPESDSFGNFGSRLDISKGVIAVGFNTISGSRTVIYFFEEVAGSWSETSRLEGDEPFGLVFAMDGDWLAVSQLSSCSAVFLYKKSGAVWGDAGRIEPEGCSSSFGGAVALSGDHLVIGDLDSVHVYEFDGSKWDLREQVAPPGEREVATFVGGVGLSTQRLVVLVTEEFVEGHREFAVVYDLSAGQLDDPTLLEMGFCGFGGFLGQRMVAVEDERIALGCPAAAPFGEVIVFDLKNESWIETALLSPNNGTGEDDFGRSVALDGDRILVGSNWGFEQGPGNELGAAYLFSQIDGSWAQTAFFPGEIAGLASTSNQGVAVALEDDLVVVGDPAYDRVGRVAIYGAPSGRFTDDDDSIFEADIEWLAAEGITKGCNPPLNTEFCPDDFVTRGQMAAFLVRALGLTDDGGGDLFVDDDHSIFERDIDRLAAAGITRGCNPPANDRFCPDDFVTRGQMAAFLVRALGLTDDGGGDLFVDDDHSIFERDIDRLAAAGITRGCNPPANDRFCPDDLVTRGQMAAFLHRALGN